MDFLKMLGACIIITYSFLVIIYAEGSENNEISLGQIEKMLKAEFGDNAPDLGLVLSRISAITKGLEDEYKNQMLLGNNTLIKIFNKARRKNRGRTPKFVFVCPQCNHKYRLYI